MLSRLRYEDNKNRSLGGGIRDMVWIDLAENRVRLLAFFECGNEPSGSIKCGGFLD